MREIYLGLAIHNHQPVGNFPWVFERSYQQAYLPLIEALERHPRILLTLHYSGPVLDWLRQFQPQLLERLRVLAARGQVDLMTGGYYEPILPAIPEADRQGQITKMSQTIARDFGCQPTGLWLAERVWEPHLPKSLALAGVEWTILDDTHFKIVGLEDRELLGYYITEEEGHPIKLFPTSKYLRYAIPWHDVDEVIAYLQDEAAETGTKIAVMGDDGEKFGVWPGTYDHCWKRGWVERFFKALEKNEEWLHTILLGKYAQAFPPLGRVYIPTASYAEMMEWALPSAHSLEYTTLLREMEAQARTDVVRYMRGGFWRSFLAKYPEANWMHKKMLRVHSKVYKARSTGKDEVGLEQLWMGQVNDPYWHGVFGGLYAADLRATLYHNLVQAECKADAAIHPPSPWLDVEAKDLDLDGTQELLVEGDALCLYLEPARGGSLREWDLHHPAYNLLCTLARRPEPYHSLLLQATSPKEADEEDVKTIHEGLRLREPGLAERICYDAYPRNSFLDHFLSPDATLKGFARGEYEELGDFLIQPYRSSTKPSEEGLCVHLEREGMVRSPQGPIALRLEKEIGVRKCHRQMEVGYKLTNLSAERASLHFASEWNINLLGGGHNEQAFYAVAGISLEDAHLDSWGVLEGADHITLGNRYLGIELEVHLDRRVRLWRFPVETVSNSESGIERSYQGSCLLLIWDLEMGPEESQSLNMTWRW